MRAVLGVDSNVPTTVPKGPMTIDDIIEFVHSDKPFTPEIVAAAAAMLNEPENSRARS